jgi:pyridoxal phosphate enzyme (YggS family)
MLINRDNYLRIRTQLEKKNAVLVAVSKTKTIEAIRELYDLGQRDFGENYVQELLDKQLQLPQDIRWHFIGHLQTNKVKYIAPFVHLIQGIDSHKLLKEINKQADKQNRVIDVLLQVYIAKEETKFGMDENELDQLIEHFKEIPMDNVQIKGLMGMASFTTNENVILEEFQHLKSLFDKYSNLQIPGIQFQILSMGMSSDYETAIQQGSNMVRIGSLIFGERQ